MEIVEIIISNFGYLHVIEKCHPRGGVYFARILGPSAFELQRVFMTTTNKKMHEGIQ
jgi:hypothetical protein